MGREVLLGDCLGKNIDNVANGIFGVLTADTYPDFGGNQLKLKLILFRIGFSF